MILDKKTAVVTGASKGLGAAIITTLVRKGNNRLWRARNTGSP